MEEKITVNDAIHQAFKVPESPYTLPSPLDSLKREDFTSDAAYLEAATDLAVKRSSPEFLEAYAQMSKEQAKRDAEKAKDDSAEAIKEARKSVRIDQGEIGEINKKAAEWAQFELRAGRLDPRKVESEISAYVAHETEKLIDKKAQGIVLSNAIRIAFGRANGNEE